ncbi:MAG: cytochrome P450 [Gemmatimonadales bacterium]
MADFHPFAEPYLLDPYPTFERLREEAPVLYDPELDYWVVSRYDDVKAVLKDAERYSNQITLAPLNSFSDETNRILEEGGYRARSAMVGTDPPYHTKARKLMNQAFTPRRVNELEPWIRHLVESRLAGLPSKGSMDLVRNLTDELPALVLFKLFGVPDDDVGLVKLGAEHRLLLVWGRPSPEQQAELARGLLVFWQHSERMVERRLREPADDLTSDLIRIRNGNDEVLTLQEIASLIFGLLFAGHETTTAFITNAVRQLLGRGTAWRDLATAPAGLPAAIEELLRLDSSVIAWRRLALQETTIGGVTVPLGARILLLLGSANHDDARFACPHQLDLDRPNVRDHIAFGFGIHYCLGAALARLETKVALECLMERFPALSLLPGQRLSFHANVAFRGPRELWVQW